MEQKITILKSLDIDEKDVVAVENQKSKNDDDITINKDDTTINKKDESESNSQQASKKEKQINKNSDEDRELF